MTDINCLYLEEITSTNTYLKEKLLHETLPEGFTVCTHYQTAGRGQRGNSWEAERGKNLLFSTVLYPTHIQANQQFFISEAISLALKDVLSEYVTNISIKWPNDIYWQEKKIAGILIENAIIETTLSYSIIGVGLNINQEVYESNAPNPTSLALITGKNYDRDIILKKIRERLFYYYSQFDFVLLNELYNQSLFRINGWHWYSDNRSSFLAQIVTVEKDGILVLRQKDDTIHKYSFKEVKFLLDK